MEPGKLDDIRKAVYGSFTEDTDPRTIYFFGMLEGKLKGQENELMWRKHYESFLKSVIIGSERFDPAIHTFEWFQSKTTIISEGE